MPGTAARVAPLWMALAVFATAAAGAPPSEPTFLIEGISIEGAERFSPEILVAESQLEEGRSYSEDQLREAVHRIVRLPLVLDAEPELRKGSEPGRYRLIVSVDEARRWIFGWDGELTRWSEPISVSGLSRRHTVHSEETLAGRRFSLGRRGLFLIALPGQDGTLTLDYTHYDLLGRSALLGIRYSVSGCGGEREDDGGREAGDDGCHSEVFDFGLDPAFATWDADGDTHRLRLSFGLPLAGNTSLRLSLFHRWAASGLRRPAFRPDPGEAFSFEDRTDAEARLAWVVSSLDDPVLPTRGVSLEAGISHRRLDARLAPLDAAAGGGPALEASSRSLLVELAAERWWPLSERQAVFASLGASLGRSRLRDLPLEGGVLADGEADHWTARLGAGHGIFLHRTYAAPQWREVRWENRAELFTGGSSPSFAQPENPLTGARLASAIVFRNTWGVFRLEVSWVGTEGR